MMPSELPDMTIPIFPLEGALLLPGGDLPLNIFEPRYLAMTRAALAGDGIIGMIQPCPNPIGSAACLLPFYTIGCAGRISEYEQTPDGRYLITLHGLSRFELVRHRICADGYREAEVTFTRFGHDNDAAVQLPTALARSVFLEKTSRYFSREGLIIDWHLADHVPDHRFFTLLAMICPFTPVEKQALLEAGTFEERCQIMKCLMDIACAGHNDASSKDRPC